MRKSVLALAFVAVAASLCGAPTKAAAQESGSGCCGKTVFVTGQFEHVRKAPGVTVTGAADPAAFAEEIYGHDFVVSVPGLEPGKYTVEIDLAETYHRAPGLRQMTITAGDTALAKDLDIFEAAGGFARAYRVSGQVEHLGDAQRGPLAIAFAASKDNAKLNAVRIRDAGGVLVASVTAQELQGVGATIAAELPVVSEPPIYTDPAQPLAKRVDDLIRRMSLAEKVAQMQNSAPAIERLGVPAYDYWNECLHGVARAGVATVFPQAIGMAATWDTDLIHTVADAIATEARAKHHQALRENNRRRYFGLTFWTPNINIFRDPRWGRGQETYGEDPFLTSRIGVAFIKGLQGDDPRYLKVMACAKHFAVHSGPEPERHEFDARPSERDFYDTYLPQFEAAVREGKVGSVMGAYNRLYGEPACSSPLLLRDLLRTKWGFTGHVVSDCGAIHDIWANHKVVPTMAEAAARAVKAGCDLECGSDYRGLVAAVSQKLVSPAEIDAALRRILEARFRLGMFDPPQRVPYARIPITENDSPAHAALALRTARESLVLLKNNGVLPLNRAKIKRLAVIGANADSVPVLLGNYNGTPSHPVTILQGIRAAAAGKIEIRTAPGCPLALRPGETQPDFREALDAARAADVVVYVGGISAELEGEEMRVNYEGFRGGDRTRIELPGVQTALLKALHATGKPVIFVHCSGSAVAMPWEARNLPAILQAWYPGQAGGTAVAQALFGDFSPAGRVPVTFYAATGDLPPFEDYGMTNRTYRYFRGKPLFAFGHGLGYTRFAYGPVTAARRVGTGGVLRVRVPVKNTGGRDGEEVVQVYVRRLRSAAGQPIRGLAAFRRVTVPRNATVRADLEIPMSRLRRWDTAKKAYVVDPGDYEIEVGASSADIRARARVTISTALRSTSVP
jgi:beta-glucosidase